jgi:aldehyde dehydrogenase (NAD+)
VTIDEQARPARPTPGSHDHDDVFVAGAWAPAGSDELLPVTDSATEDDLALVRSASPAVVNSAVEAAAQARPGWSSLAPAERAGALRRLHAALATRSLELTSLISAEVGTSVRICTPIQVDSALELLRLTAELLETLEFEEQVANSTVLRREVGVVAAITPWNYPLFQTMGKIAAALAAGCTVVHKPSELAPLSAFILAEAVEQAGLPAGVYNLVPGRGQTVGEQLADSGAVNMVSFTGSTGAGRRVYELAARSIKRVTLELGGKSPSVLLSDADLGAAVRTTVNRAFLNSGQTCDAWTRMVVHRDQLDEVLGLTKSSVERFIVGDPFDEATRLGPLVSAKQVERVRRYITEAIESGATALLGGAEAPAGLDRGFYVSPTVLTDVQPSMAVVREEIFGPVLVVLTYDSEDQALSIANDSMYGLSAAVWSADTKKAMAFARRIEAGQVVVNGGRFNPQAPFGGLKQSGVGRELGRFGIEEFLETRALQH